VLSCFGVIHDNRFPGTKEIINGQGILFDQHVRLSGLPGVIDQVAAQVAAADDDYMIFHFAGEHAASFL